MKDKAESNGQHSHLMCRMKPELVSFQLGQKWGRSRGNLTVTWHGDTSKAWSRRSHTSEICCPMGSPKSLGHPDKSIQMCLQSLISPYFFSREICYSDKQTYRHHIRDFRGIYFSGYLPFISVSRHLILQTMPIQMSLKWADALYLIAWWLLGLDWSSRWWIG